ncbi:MAG: nucleotidyl transferase AbiEii/AbiGii toxin family protein, partial [Thermomicrobiales bacterium]
GVDYLADTARSSMIRDDALYSEVRVLMPARIATAQVKLQLDINFGDPVTPGPRPVEIPSLRGGLEPVRIAGYPIETVLAEKLTTAIDLGEANTRVRDWADIYSLTGSQQVKYDDVRAALEATASFRGTTLSPLAAEIGALATARDATYRAYRRQLGPDGDHLPEALDDIVAAVVAFADPIIDRSAAERRWNPTERRWEG